MGANNVTQVKKPPTLRQLERLDEMLDDPKITPHLDELDLKWDTMLRTFGGTGLMISWMKRWIAE